MAMLSCLPILDIAHNNLASKLFLRLTNVSLLHTQNICNSSPIVMLQNVPILSCLGILTHRAVSIGIPKLHVINFEIQMSFCSGNFRKYFSKPNSLLN
jgi:hypothetical protein